MDDLQSLSHTTWECKYHVVWVSGQYGLMLPKSLYAFLIAGMSMLINDREIAATLVSVISGGLLIIPVFYLGKALFNTTTAWLGAILIILSPYLIEFSGWILTESLFTFIFIACFSLTAVLLVQGGGWYKWIFLGILTELAYIAREVGIIVFPIVFIWTLSYLLLTNKRKFWNTIVIIIFLSTGFLSAYISSNIVSHHINRVVQERTMPEGTGTKTSTSTSTSTRENTHKVSLGVRLGTMVSTIIYTPDLSNPNTSEQTSRLTQDGSGYEPIRKAKGSDAHIIKVLWEGKYVLLKMSLKGVWRYASVSRGYFSIIFIIFLIVGFLTHFMMAKRMGMPFLISLFLPSLVIGYFAVLIFSGTANFASGDWELCRYMTPLFPIFFLWAGFGIENGAKWLADVLKKIGMPLDIIMIKGWQVVIVILAIMVLATFLPHAKHLKVYDGNRESFARAIGEEIKKRSPHPPLIMARTTAIPYYAGADFLMIPFESYERVLEFARGKGVDFIVIARSDRRPLLRNLLIITGSKPGLKIEFGVRDPQNPDYMVFAVYRVLK